MMWMRVRAGAMWNWWKTLEIYYKLKSHYFENQFLKNPFLVQSSSSTFFNLKIQRNIILF